MDKPAGKLTLVKTLLRLSLGVGLLAWLVWANRSIFARLQAEELRWGYLGAGLLLTFGAILTTLYRWYLLVVAQGLPFRLQDALRIGFIGYLFSQVIPGAVSGDLVKIVMLVREQERRTVAVATIVLDRIVGLYALTLVAGLAALVSWPQLREVSALRDLVLWDLALIVAGTVGFVLLFAPIFHGRWSQSLSRIPAAGGLIRELLGSIVAYQGKSTAVLGSLLLGVLAHIGFVSALYCVAAGLQGPLWPARVHFVVAPLGLMINAIPISPGGLGVGEAAMQALFGAAGQDGAKAFLMMLGFRASSWIVALIGVGYLVFGQASARKVISEVRASESPILAPAPCESDAERRP